MQDKYVTISVNKKNVEEARSYFARFGADLIGHFNRLGARCTEVDAVDRLRIFHDFYRTGEETAFSFDMVQSIPDNAIILIACRLGLRCADIKGLRFENFNWTEKKLCFVQSKTKQPMELPLVPDVGWAVIDYLKYGRPKVDSPYIFVRHMAPFLPFSEDDHLNQLIKAFMVKAHTQRQPIIPGGRNETAFTTRQSRTRNFFLG